MVNQVKLPPKQRYDATAISDRRKELAEYSKELLHKFAIKRGVIPTDKSTNKDLIDGIIAVEYEAK